MSAGTNYASNIRREQKTPLSSPHSAKLQVDGAAELLRDFSVDKAFSVNLSSDDD